MRPVADGKRSLRHSFLPSKLLSVYPSTYSCMSPPMKPVTRRAHAYAHRRISTHPPTHHRLSRITCKRIRCPLPVKYCPASLLPYSARASPFHLFSSGRLSRQELSPHTPLLTPSLPPSIHLCIHPPHVYAGWEVRSRISLVYHKLGSKLFNERRYLEVYATAYMHTVTLTHARTHAHAHRTQL